MSRTEFDVERVSCGQQDLNQLEIYYWWVSSLPACQLTPNVPK
jgi:hypothetical protein